MQPTRGWPGTKDWGGREPFDSNRNKKRIKGGKGAGVKRVPQKASRKATPTNDNKDDDEDDKDGDKEEDSDEEEEDDDELEIWKKSSNFAGQKRDQCLKCSGVKKVFC
jgi:hypothetical protein